MSVGKGKCATQVVVCWEMLMLAVAMRLGGDAWIHEPKKNRIAGRRGLLS